MMENENSSALAGATGVSVRCPTAKRTGTEANLPPARSQAQAFDLNIGGRKTGVAIERDAAWPCMWRVCRGTDRSDIVNITRAKDAAIAWARPRGLGGDEEARWYHREMRSRASLVRSNGGRVA
jgi:hypothetical protein